MESLKFQSELLEIVIELQRLDHRLQSLAAGLPRPPHQDHMLEGRIPSDVATEIYGAITYGRAEQLRPLIESLAAATQVSVESLQQRFRMRQEGFDEPLPRTRPGIQRFGRAEAAEGH